MIDLQHTAAIQMDVRGEKLCGIFPFLQQGFYVITRSGASIGGMLQNQFGIHKEYIEERIKTLFLNGHPVDNVETAILRDGDSLALSAAMPGLVGAVLRRGGCLSPFRATISHRNDAGSFQEGDGTVQLKLFNLLIDELGPAFLQYGVLISKDDFLEFLEMQPDTFWGQIEHMQYNQESTDKNRLKNGISAQNPQWVFLKLAHR